MAAIRVVLAVSLACAASLAGGAVASATGTPAAAAAGGLTSAFLAYGTDTASASSQPQVWALGAGASAQLLGPGQDPLLADDGQWVAASLAANGDSGPSLAIYPVDGAAAQTYGNLAQATAQPLAWSPDSRYLAVAFSATSVGNAQARASSLAVIDVETGALTTLAHGFVQGASFAPNGSDELAYGLTQAFTETAPVNVHIVDADGAHARALTHDGRSLNPVWGASGIVYDRERLRHLEFPVYQLWLARPTGARARQLTHMQVSPLVSGLVPLAFSASGSRLLAEFEGQDTSSAWTVTVSSGRARALTAGNRSLIGAGISQDGSTVLVDVNAFEVPPSSGSVATMPFGGGPLHVLVAHGAEASWSE